MSRDRRCNSIESSYTSLSRRSCERFWEGDDLLIRWKASGEIFRWGTFLRACHEHFSARTPRISSSAESILRLRTAKFRWQALSSANHAAIHRATSKQEVDAQISWQAPEQSFPSEKYLHARLLFLQSWRMFLVVLSVRWKLWRCLLQPLIFALESSPVALMEKFLAL